MKWLVWNVERARPVGAALSNMGDAVREADRRKSRYRRHYVVVPSPLATA